MHSLKSDGWSYTSLVPIICSTMSPEGTILWISNTLTHVTKLYSFTVNSCKFWAIHVVTDYWLPCLPVSSFGIALALVYLDLLYAYFCLCLDLDPGCVYWTVLTIYLLCMTWTCHLLTIFGFVSPLLINFLLMYPNFPI